MTSALLALAAQAKQALDADGAARPSANPLMALPSQLLLHVPRKQHTFFPLRSLSSMSCQKSCLHVHPCGLACGYTLLVLPYETVSSRILPRVPLDFIARTGILVVFALLWQHQHEQSICNIKETVST